MTDEPASLDEARASGRAKVRDWSAFRRDQDRRLDRQEHEAQMARDLARRAAERRRVGWDLLVSSLAVLVAIVLMTALGAR